ncbi:MAG: PEP-CTERM sorting domain-containing protein [Armatimonadetes bacterium]|nr:PEP-CTERM sorting domain-containing protein [Armatimonadota bacterium]
MKKSLLIGLMGVGGMLLTAQSQALLLAHWNFNNAGTLLTASSTDSSVSSASLTPSVTATTVTGSLINAVGADPAGTALTFNPAPNNSTLTWQINSTTSTFSNLVVTFAQQRSGTGPQTNTVEASVDGTNWFGAVATTVPTSFALATANFSSVPQVNGFSTFYVRATLTAGTGGTFRVDNFQINGDVAPVPEPTSLAAIGIGAVALIRRKKAR